jgi:hypothetical protein
MPSKEPVLPLLASTARTDGGDDQDSSRGAGAQQQPRRASITGAGDGRGGGGVSYETRDIQSTDELLYVGHLILPFSSCKHLQHGLLSIAIPMIVKALELYLLINVLLEDGDTSYLKSTRAEGLENKPNIKCPMDGGQNVYSLSLSYFLSLSLMAAIYGAALFVNDVMYVGRGMICMCSDSGEGDDPTQRRRGEAHPDEFTSIRSS